MKLKWRCKACDDVITSEEKRWQMDYCKCGKSSVDLEEHYYRFNGDVDLIGWIED